MSMGDIAANAKHFECGNCEGTYTGSWNEVSNLGWRKHEWGDYRNKQSFILCGDCEEMFSERRRAAKAAE